MFKNGIKITRVKEITGICKENQIKSIHDSRFKLAMRNKGQEFNLAQKKQLLYTMEMVVLQKSPNK